MDSVGYSFTVEQPQISTALGDLSITKLYISLTLKDQR